MTIGKKVTKRGGEKHNFYFLELRYISFYSFPNHKSSHNYRKHFDEGNRVSVFFYFGPSFDFMKSRKIIMQK